MRIATIAENEVKLKLVMLIGGKIFVVVIAMNLLLLACPPKLEMRLVPIVVFAISEFLVKIETLQKISKIKKSTFRIKTFMHVTARKHALKRERIKVARV